MSGARTERPGLNAALSFLRNGDTLVVWKLGRLGRSMTHLLQTGADLEDRGVGFRSLTENIDTTTPTGRLVFHIFGAFGEFERDHIRERTNAGLTAAAGQGPKRRSACRRHARKSRTRPSIHCSRPHCARGRRTREARQVRPLRCAEGWLAER